MQPCYVSIYPSELFTCSLHFKPRYTLLMGTPIHSQKQTARSPKPETKVFSATVKSVNLLISAILGCQKLTALLLQEVQVFCLLLCKKGTGLPLPHPTGCSAGTEGFPAGSGSPPAQWHQFRLSALGAVRDRVSHSSAQGTDVSNAFWTAVLQTGTGTAPPDNGIKITQCPSQPFLDATSLTLGLGEQ